MKTDLAAAVPGKRAIIADDLTGALDSAAALLPWGIHALVVLGEQASFDASCIAVTTDSRSCTPAEACLRTRAAASFWHGRALYLKIDSTLRGSVGANIDGCLDGSRLEHALITPAFPATGRTVQEGQLLVDGVPLAETPFAEGPANARSSHIPTLLARHTRRPVAQLGLSTVESGPEAVAAALSCEKAPLVVADATTAEHLRCLAQGLAQVGPGWLPCGSAGLAAFWPLALGASPAAAPSFSWPSSSLPVLLICASRNPATLAQVEQARASGMVVIEVEPRQKDTSLPCRLAIDSLAAGHDTILTVAPGPFRRGEESLTAQRLANCARCAAEAGRGHLAGLFLTGGDTAYAVCQALDATALRVVGEVVTGVPLSILQGGLFDGLHVVTKAGGFGQADVLLTAVAVLRRGSAAPSVEPLQ